MKLKQFKCPETDVLFEYNETAEIYVSEDAENLMTVEQVDKMISEGKIKFNEDDVVVEKKAAKKESDDEEDDDEDGTDDDEAVDEEKDEEDDESVDEEKPDVSDDDDEDAIDEEGDSGMDDDDEEEVDEACDKDKKDESDDEEDMDESLELDYSVSLTEEDRSALFEGEELSEEYQTKTITIFEAAVSAKVKELAVSAKSHYKTISEKKVAKLEESLQTQVNDYLDYVVTEWMGDNEIAIENGLKNEMNDEFLEGLKGLFTEHYIEVPEGRYDILEGLANKVESLEEKLDTQLEANSTLMAENKGQTKDKIVLKLSEGLSANQAEKFAALVEHVTSDDLTEFETKAQSLKESYFKKADPADKDESSINESQHNIDNVVISKEWDDLIARASNI